MLKTFYIICLTVGGLYSMLSFIFSNMLNLDFDFDIDFDFDFDFDLSSILMPLKPFTVMVFAAVFGGVGLISLNYMSPPATLIPSIPLGIAVSGGMYYLVYVKLRGYETLTASEGDAVMQRAEVVERIMPGGYGRISYVINGNTLSGVAKEKKPGGGIDKGRKVYIMEVRDNTYFVSEDLEFIIDNRR